MKVSKFVKIILMLSLALALVGSGFAADAHKANFQISESVQVNGTELAPGDYVAKWTGDGPDVQVSITRNGKEVAKAPAKLVQLAQKASDDASEIRKGNNGKELSTLQFAGRKYSLELGSSPAAASNASVK